MSEISLTGDNSGCLWRIRFRSSFFAGTVAIHMKFDTALKAFIQSLLTGVHLINAFITTFGGAASTDTVKQNVLEEQEEVFSSMISRDL